VGRCARWRCSSSGVIQGERIVETEAPIEVCEFVDSSTYPTCRTKLLSRRREFVWLATCDIASGPLYSWNFIVSLSSASQPSQQTLNLLRKFHLPLTRPNNSFRIQRFAQIQQLAILRRTVD